MKRYALALATCALTLSAEVAMGGDAPQKLKGGSSFVSADRTNIDFSETMIDGKMQAPSGFFLQGRQAQSMTNMVKLRSKFRSELRNSKSAVKAVVK
jgi:hypothetical protein